MNCTRHISFILVATWLFLPNHLQGGEPVAARQDSDSDRGMVVFTPREQALVKGLRRRGLYDLAKFHCDELLVAPTASLPDIAALTVEQIRTQTNKALTTETADRQQESAIIDQMATAFASQRRDHPRAVLVKVQQGLSHLSFAKLLRQELAGQYGDESSRQKGLEHLSTARAIFQKSFESVRELRDRQRNRAVNIDSLSDEQLQTLETNIQYQLAITNLVNAKFYDLGKPDATEAASKLDSLNQIDSLNMVAKQLANVRRSISDTKVLWWQTWVDEIACQRLLGNIDIADTILKRLRSPKRPSSTNLPLVAEEIELALSSSDVKRMQVLADRVLKTKKRNANVDVALVRLLVSIGRIDEAAALTQTIDSKYGPYWARRAELALLTRGANPSNGRANSAVSAAEENQLLRVAEEAQRKGNLDNAIKGYLSVARGQFAKGDETGGLQTIVRAGKLMEQQGKRIDAASLFVDRAIKAKKQPLAASVHLRGCWNLIQAIQNKDEKAETISFRDRLNEHITVWPKSESANQARYWLGSELVGSKDFDAAADVLLKVDPSSSHFPASVELAQFAQRRILTKLESDGKTVSQTSKRMLNQWDRVLKRCSGNSKPMVGAAMAALAIGWRSEPLDQTVGRMKQISSKQPVNLPAEFILLLAVAEAGNSKSNLSEQDIEKTVQEAFKKSPDDRMLQRVISIIDRAIQNATNESMTLSFVKLQIASEAARRSQSPVSKRKFQLASAEALSRTSRIEDARAIYDELLAKNKDDLKAKSGLARLLASSPATSGEAIKQWRTIASRTKPQSGIWFEAKYNVAKILATQKKKEEAKKLLQYIKAIPPGWDNSDLKEQFESLLRRCSN